MLKKRGMKPNNSLFEFGIGYLRSSNNFINYLEEYNFTGNDTSKKRIDRGQELFSKVKEKKPNFIVSSDNTLDWLDGKKYDYIYSHAVFCHMPMDDIKEVFINIRKKAMHNKSEFYTTYSVLDFKNFRGYESEQYNESDIKKIFKEKDQMHLYEEMKYSQNKDMIQTGVSNWFHSRKYMESFALGCGFIVEDVTNSLGDEAGLCYSPWNRLLKMKLI